jgi:hypothetical protein
MGNAIEPRLFQGCFAKPDFRALTNIWDPWFSKLVQMPEAVGTIGNLVREAIVMERREHHMAIEKELVDQILAGRDPNEVFACRFRRSRPGITG